MSYVARNYSNKTTMFRMATSKFFPKVGCIVYWRSTHPTVFV